jgi:sugar-specific transcriptional regulator TrmB
MKRESPLLVLGVSAEAQKIYETLLAHPGSSVADVARLARIAKPRATRVLKSLEANGMANRLPERVARYFPTPPDVAMDLLMTKKQDELQRARVVAERWQGKLRHAAVREQPVEIISGREAIMRRFQHLHRISKDEIVCLERPPYVVSATYHYSDVQKHAMARGVGLRTIIDTSVVGIPGKLESLQRNVASGEIIRILPRLPMKLLIADRRIALVPLTLEQARDIALVLRPSLLLDALSELFEIMWERGAPFGTADVAAPQPEKARRAVDSDRLVSLLAAGMNDKSIAQEFGISARTLERRILELLKALDSRTRFQAGWQAAHRTRKSRSASGAN